MALGLNIVVGYAGLLDLGYVAFFAVGAYTTAILTSPTITALHPRDLGARLLPFVMAAPPSPAPRRHPGDSMRGDYLAIVTLGLLR